MATSIHLLDDWKKQIQNEAMIFASDMERGFLSRINRAKKFLPKQSEENLTELVMTFVDALVTTSVGISGSYVNKSQFFEDAIIQAIRDKFQLLRKMDIEKI